MDYSMHLLLFFQAKIYWNKVGQIEINQPRVSFTLKHVNQPLFVCACENQLKYKNSKQPASF